MELGDVSLSRILFAFTAMYHFLFVPLTIGLAALVAVLEGIGLWTRQPVWRDAARFWGWFFALNFACGVLTGYPLRWQIEAHWAAYGSLVEDVVGTVFAFEGRLFPVLLALVALFTLGWRLPAALHFGVSVALAVALVLQSSAILALNAWMQLPVGHTLVNGKAQVEGLDVLLANPLVVPKILHQIASAWTLAGMLVVAGSAWFLLRRRHVLLARSSFRVASVFTLVALVVTALAGHASGAALVKYQPVKFAAIEALWKTEHANDFVLFALPDVASRSNRYEVAVPGLLGWLAGSDDAPVRGLDTLARETAAHIRRDLATSHTRMLASGQPLPPVGYAGLLPPGSTGTDAQIEAAAQRAIPRVPVVFWAFRVMLAAWAALTVLMVWALWRAPRAGHNPSRWLLWCCMAALPLPWLATEAGWMVCEIGRQPWSVTGVLPTFRSGAVLDTGYTGLKLLGFSLAYSGLFVLNIALALRHLRRGPYATADGVSLVRGLAAAWARRPAIRRGLRRARPPVVAKR